jgi:hypothetical protein
MMSSLDAVLAQYEKSQQGGGGAQGKMSQDERMKKYFALILGDKEKSGINSMTQERMTMSVLL